MTAPPAPACTKCRKPLSPDDIDDGHTVHPECWEAQEQVT